MATNVIDYSFRQPIIVTLRSSVTTTSGAAANFSYDLSDCLKSLSFGLPNHEPESLLTWQGSLELMLSQSAEARGITPAILNPTLSPQLWMRGLATIEIQFGIFGQYGRLKFRIEKSSYDAQAKKCSVALAQQLSLSNVTIPEIYPDIVYSEQFTTLYTATDAFTRALNSYSLASNQLVWGDKDLGMGGDELNSREGVWGQRSTRSPLGELLGLTKQYWSFLCQSLRTELAEIRHVDYGTLPIAFAKPLSAAIVEPSLDNIDFSAPKILAAGSASLPYPCSSVTFITQDPDNRTFVNEFGYPYKNVTVERKPTASLFPQLTGNTVPLISQRKTIEYFYTTTNIIELPSYEPFYAPVDEMSEDSGLFKIRTTIEQPAGVVFPQIGVDVTLIKSSIILETVRTRGTMRPAGLVFPERNKGKVVDFALVQDNVEKLTSGVGNSFGSGTTARGDHQCTDYVKPAKTRKVNLRLNEQSFRGEASIDQGYLPALNFPMIYSIGYCSSQSLATRVAERLAVRETARKYADEVTLPVPIEYLAAHCPQFVAAHVGTKVYQVDQRQLSFIVDEEGRVSGYMSFTGNLLRLASAVPEAPAQLVYDPTGNAFASELEAAVGLLPPTVRAVAGTTTRMRLV